MAYDIIYVNGANRVLVESPTPASVLYSVAGSKIVRYKDRDWVACPHDLDSVDALRQLGYDVEANVNFGGYKYTGRYTPFAHQAQTVAFMATHRKAFNFSHPGTGKTSSALWAADYLIKQGKVKKVLVVAPLTTLRDVWERECFTTVTHLSTAVLSGTKAQRCIALAQDVDIYITNHDGVKTMYHEIQARADIDLVIVDESTAYKTPTADRTKAMMRIGLTHNRRFWAMTGTPMANMPTDVWTMARVICPELVPKSFNMFREQTCHKITNFKWAPRADAVQMVLDRLHPAICFRKKDCLDLPAVMTIQRHVEPSPNQMNFIKTIKSEFVAEIGGKEITAANAAILIGKVLQVLEGVVIHDSSTGEGIIIGAQSRIDVLKELIESSNSKTIVFAPYTKALDYLQDELKEYGIGRIDGSVSETKRAVILRKFEEDPSMRVLIAHPRTTSHGLTLTSASTIIFYGPIHSPEVYEQAINRIDRPGQKFSMTVAQISGHPIESRIYDTVAKKMRIQTQLLDMVAQITTDAAL